MCVCVCGCVCALMCVHVRGSTEAQDFSDGIMQPSSCSDTDLYPGLYCHVRLFILIPNVRKYMYLFFLCLVFRSVSAHNKIFIMQSWKANGAKGGFESFKFICTWKELKKLRKRERKERVRHRNSSGMKKIMWQKNKKEVLCGIGF